MEEKIKKIADELKTELNGKANTNEVKELSTKLETLNQLVADFKKLKEEEKTEEKYNLIQEQIKTVNDRIEEIETKKVGNKNIQVKEFTQVYKENLTNLQERKNSRKQGFVDLGYINTKAVGAMTTANITGTGDLPLPQLDAGFNEYAKDVFVLTTSANVTPTNSPLVQYVEKVAGEGTAGMTAEGTAKSQIDFDLVKAQESVKKMTAYIKVSDEMLTDIDGIRNEINTELLYALALKQETQLFSGDGVGTNLKGITKVGYAKTLSLAGLQNIYATNTSTMHDQIHSCLTQIRENMKQKGRANRIYVSAVDYQKLITEKTSVGDYYRDPDTQSITVGGVPVIIADFITAGNVLVADMNKYHVRFLEMPRVQIGWENDDFTTNYITILVEQRLCSYIKANDTEAFIYDSFANIKAFIEA